MPGRTLRLQSLRARLSLWLAVQSLLGLGAVCLVVYLATALNQVARQDEALAQKEAIVRHLLTNTEEHVPAEHTLKDFLIGHDNFRLVVRSASGVLLFPDVLPAEDGAPRASRVFEVPAPQGSGTAFRVALSMDITGDVQHLQRLGVTLAVAALVGAVLISVGGFTLVGLGLRPVRQLAGQLRSLSASNLGQRLNMAGQPAELAPFLEQFNGLLERLDLAYQQLEGFNADVSHELRTPLATLLASNELTLRHPERFAMVEVLASNLEELQRLKAMVNDMLFLSQADRGALARRVPVGSLADLAAQVAEYHEAALAEAGLTLRIEGDGSGQFDVALLRRALSNLLDNATQYATRDTQVQVRIAQVAGGWVRMAVANQGEAVPAATLQRMFNRFFRASTSRTHGQKNHGLGLAITAAIARMHAGETTARCENGWTEVGILLASKPPDRR
ncbi:heavy metal sensor histidine kinase [Acidovorax sp. DW039]|uniref:heavy metal sensor histidine kinase n=1 Tax=Acidovorax sp. DW039 TaxID=3095606 RepID=UPI00308AAE2B|nr:heavy metal sensor histidine kinase [Acidovorax sp. DW039]